MGIVSVSEKQWRVLPRRGWDDIYSSWCPFCDPTPITKIF